MLRRDSPRNRKTICQHHWFKFVLMTDYVRPHRANIMSQNRDAETIKKTGRSSKSLDLNTIKHVWDVLQRKVQQCVPPKTNILKFLCYINDIVFSEWPLFTHSKFPQRKKGSYLRDGATQLFYICWTNCCVLSKQIMQLLDIENWKFTLIGIVPIIVNLFFCTSEQLP